MALKNFPVSAVYFNKALILGLASFSTFVFSQKTDSIKEKSIEEVVVVGYGKQKKSKVSGAVSEVELDKLTSRSLSGVGAALQGKSPGVVVVNEGGDPTSAPRVNIRGLGGINGEAPLYVVDGSIYNGTPSINPNDIESISVLKDATAAIYGARASGGVILITTKRGKKGVVRLTVDSKFGVQNAWKTLKPLDAAQFQEVISQAYTNVGKPVPASFDVNKYPEGAITRTNWMDEIFRTASIQEYNVDVTGGGEKSNFFMNLNHRNNMGTLINTKALRYNFRINSDHQVKDWLKVGENMFYSFTNGNTVDTQSGYTGAILAALYYPPNIPVYDAKGNFSGLPLDRAGDYADIINPVAYLSRVNVDVPSHTLILNPYLEVKFLPGLTFKSNLSGHLTFNDSKVFNARTPEVGKVDMNNRLTYGSTRGFTILTEQTLNYVKAFGLHNFDVLGGYSYQKNTSQGFSAFTENFTNENEIYLYLNNGLKFTNKPSSFKSASAITSLFGRFNYDYAGKYMISVLGRHDGSSLVAEKNRYADYYSVSGAWVASKENFFQNSIMNYLKLRGSYGILGNLGNLRPSSVDPLMIQVTAYLGDNPAANFGYMQNDLPNYDLKWADSKQTGAGVDFGFLRNRLTGQFDWFKKETTNMIFSHGLPGTTGMTGVVYENAGLVEDRGIELGLNWTDKLNEDFGYSVYANISTLKNQVKALLPGQNEMAMNGYNVRGTLAPVWIKVGDPMYSFYGYKTDGLFQTQEEINNYKDANGNLILPNAKPGDIKFLRAPGNDGKLDPTKDYVNLGNPYPDFTYSFGLNLNYRNFDFNAFFQGTKGNKIFNGLKFMSLNPGGAAKNLNMDSTILDAWSPTNTGSSIPRLAYGDPAGNYSKASDFYVEDGSYLRLKNLTVGYTIPEDTTQKIGINTARAYITASNLFTVTKYTGMDPEVGMNNLGIDVGRYPQPRAFIFGLTIGL